MFTRSLIAIRAVPRFQSLAMSELESLCHALEDSLHGLPAHLNALQQRASRLRMLAAQIQEAASRVEHPPEVGRIVHGLHESASAMDASGHSLTVALEQSRNFVSRTIGGSGSGSVDRALGTPGGPSVARSMSGGSDDRIQGISLDYEDLLQQCAPISDSTARESLEQAWVNSYCASAQGRPEIVAFSQGSFTWVYDIADSSGGPPARLIGVYGRSDPQGEPRDDRRIAGFPSPQRDFPIPVHRGHAAGHQLGGPDEGYNLFPQVGAVNQGGRWRDLERYCADNPGTFMFMHAVYQSDSDAPALLEYGVERDGTLTVERFKNL